MNDRNGKMEKLTNNLLTIFLARGAMIVTPVVFSFFVYVGFQVLDDIRNRVAATELQISVNSKIIQDHESRITYNRSDAVASQRSYEGKFDAIDGGLESVSTSLNSLILSVGKLETVINERVPKQQRTSP